MKNKQLSCEFSNLKIVSHDSAYILTRSFYLSLRLKFFKFIFVILSSFGCLGLEVLKMKIRLKKEFLYIVDMNWNVTKIKIFYSSSRSLNVFSVDFLFSVTQLKCGKLEWWFELLESKQEVYIYQGHTWTQHTTVSRYNASHTHIFFLNRIKQSE